MLAIKNATYALYLADQEEKRLERENEENAAAAAANANVLQQETIVSNEGVNEAESKPVCCETYMLFLDSVGSLDADFDSQLFTDILSSLLNGSELHGTFIASDVMSVMKLDVLSSWCSQSQLPIPLKVYDFFFRLCFHANWELMCRAQKYLTQKLLVRDDCSWICSSSNLLEALSIFGSSDLLIQTCSCDSCGSYGSCDSCEHAAQNDVTVEADEVTENANDEAVELLHMLLRIVILGYNKQCEIFRYLYQYL